MWLLLLLFAAGAAPVCGLLLHACHLPVAVCAAVAARSLVLPLHAVYYCLLTACSRCGCLQPGAASACSLLLPAADGCCCAACCCWRAASSFAACCCCCCLQHVLLPHAACCRLGKLCAVCGVLRWSGAADALVDSMTLLISLLMSLSFPAKVSPKCGGRHSSSPLIPLALCCRLGHPVPLCAVLPQSL